MVCIIGAQTAGAFQSDFMSLFSTADRAFEAGDYETAATYYEQGIFTLSATAPGEYIALGYAYSQLGRSYALMGNLNMALISSYRALDMGTAAMDVDRENALRIVIGSHGAILDTYDTEGLFEPMREHNEIFIAFLEEYQKNPLPDEVIPQADIKNYLAYCYAQNEVKLEEALTLITEALVEYPDSAAMLDTKGWVLYKLGRIDEARDYLEHALKQCEMEDGDCFIIQRHLDEVSTEKS
jgi:tetratricopeptide (TPR) repeat protein